MRILARTILSAAVVSAVGITACMDATRSTASDPAIYEGARISLTGVSSVSIPTLDGRVISSAAHQWAVDGIVTKGIAEAEGSGSGLRTTIAEMPALAIADNHPLANGRPNQRFYLSAKDRAGNPQDFAILTGKDGGPAKSVVHIEKGRIAEAYSFQWRRVRGGWVAAGFAVTVFKNSKPIAMIRAGTKLTPHAPSSMIAADDPCMFDAEYAALSGNCDGAPTFGGGGSGGYGGGGSGGPCSCATQLTDYLLAASTAATATQVAVDTGTALIPMVAAGLAAAWAAAAVMLYRYNSCVRACAQQTGSAAIMIDHYVAVARPFAPEYWRPA